MFNVDHYYKNIEAHFPSEDIPFEQKIQRTLDEIGFAYFTYDESEFWMYEEVYNGIKDYAIHNELYNTAVALAAVRGLYSGTYSAGSIKKDGKEYHIPYVQHCLSVCKILIDIRMSLSKEEMDILLAGALCHGLLANIFFTERGQEMISIYHLDKEVLNIMNLVSRKQYLSERSHQAFFDRLQENKLALLVRLADRSNYVEQLYNIPVWKAREYIHETRTYYFPMCFYAKENYVELDAVFSIFLEKMRSLLEVTDIMVTRFEATENDLTSEILTLREENARLRGFIRKKKAELGLL